MKHIQKFETFFIPKSIRKPIWKDEDIAIQTLSELKSMKGDIKAISELQIKKVQYTYQFNLDGFNFTVEYNVTNGMLGKQVWSSLEMNMEELDVSDEICKQIFKTIEELKNFEEPSISSYDKKDFRLRAKKLAKG